MINSLIIDNIEYKLSFDWDNEKVIIQIPYSVSEIDDLSNQDSFITEDILHDNNDYYFKIPNLRALWETRNYLDSFWSNKAYDAYLMLRDKIADGLIAPYFEFNTGLKFEHDLIPIKYLDESISNLMQAKSLNGWRDIQVKYVIAKHSKFSMNPIDDFVVATWHKDNDTFIYHKNSYMFSSGCNEDDMILMFDSFDKANKVLSEVKQSYYDNLIKGGMSIARAADKTDSIIWSIKQIIL